MRTFLFRNWSACLTIKESEVNAVGVVSRESEFKGIIIRKELMKLISRPFGLDVLKKKPVSRVTVIPRIFDATTPSSHGQ